MPSRALVATTRDAVSEGSREFFGVLVGATVLLLAVEWLVFLDRLYLGRWLALVAYVAFTLVAAWREEWASVLGAFALLIVFRIVNLTVPTLVDLTLYWIPLVYVPFLPAALLATRASPAISLRIMPTDHSPRLLIGVLLAVGLAFTSRQSVPPFDVVPEPTPVALATFGLILLFVTTVEEILFRGVLQSAISARAGGPVAVVVSSIAFAAMHQYPTPSAVVFVLAAGFVYGTLYELTDSILVSTAVHAVSNLLLFVVLPYELWKLQG